MVYRLVSLIESQAMPEMSFDSAQDAIAFARSNGLKAKPEIIVDDTWIAREADRLGDGTHERLPWHYFGWFLYREEESNRFPHVAKKDPTKIAFTESPEKGMRDIQTVLTPGRYLERFYSDFLTSEGIRDLAREYVTRLDVPTLSIARLSTEIVSIYRNGPASCMSHNMDSYSGNVHPVSVYGLDSLDQDQPDALVLAYLKKDDRITARALINERDKAHMRVYGDIDLLKKALEAAGYSAQSPHGYTVKKIPYDCTYIMPYIDEGQYSGAASVDIRGNRFVITEDGDYCASETCGLLSEPEPEGEYCEYYEETRDEESYCVVIDSDGETQQWSESACGNHATQINGQYYSDGIVRTDGHGDIIIDGVNDDDFSYCDRTCEYWPRDEMVFCSASEDYYHQSVCIEVKTEHGTCHVSERDANANSFICLIDGERWHNEARHSDFIDVACIHDPSDSEIESLQIVRVNHFPHPDQLSLAIAA